MIRSEVKELVLFIMEALTDKDVEESDNLRDKLDMDSMDFLNVIHELEVGLGKGLNIEFKYSLITELKWETVSDIVDTIMEIKKNEN
jgi:acyl carrier protein